MRRFAWKGNVPPIWWMFLRLSNSSTSDLDYYNEHGDPVYVHMQLMYSTINTNIWFNSQSAQQLEKVRNSMESSTSNEKCPTVLLKADTGAHVNLMNSRTFDSLFNRNRTILQPSLLRMEAYGNSAVEVLGKFHAFLRWKGRVYRQLFYVTSANNSPNLLLKGWLLHPWCDQTLLLCGIDRKFQQFLWKSRSRHPLSLQLP